MPNAMSLPYMQAQVDKAELRGVCINTKGQIARPDHACLFGNLCKTTTGDYHFQPFTAYKNEVPECFGSLRDCLKHIAFYVVYNEG